MAVKLQPRLLSVLLFCCCFIHFSSGQSDSPLNIEVFYPFPIPSPAPPNNTHISTPSPSPVTSLPPSPPPLVPVPIAKQDSTSNRTVAKAVGATAASTFVVSAVLFFIICLARRRRETGSSGTQAVGSAGDGGGVDEFTRFDGNVKELIVDENGLDVFYWKKLESVDQRNSGSQKSVFDGPKHGGEEEEKEIIHGGNQRIQEIPLIRGRSSSSCNKVAPEVDDRHRITAPPVDIAVQAIQKSPSHPPPPVPSKAMPPPPPPVASKSMMSVPKSKNAARSPPPPVASKAVMSAPKNQSAVQQPPPPPPPPVPAKKYQAPPPPPPRPNSSKQLLVHKALQSESKVGVSSSGQGMAGSGNDQVKLKPLHWDKLKPNGDHSMVWDKIDNGSFRFDGDLMEALFGYVAANKKSPRGDNSSTKPTSPSQIVILDPRKSQNTAIIIKSLSIPRREILDALNEGDGLELETLEKLTRVAPTDEEKAQILEFNGDITRLADAESFLYHLLKAFPSAFTQFNAMIFRSNYGSEISQFKESLQTLESACKELRSRRLFMKLLEAILKAGNRMNAGTTRGNAQAFKLTSLQKLSDVKSIDGKTTLLHFVVEQVVRSEGKRCCAFSKNRSLSRCSSQSSNSSIISETNSACKDEREKEYMMLGLPIVGGLSSEFSNVKKAATMDYDTFAGTCSALTARVAEYKQLVTQCDGAFVREMSGFLEAAEKELKIVREDQMKVMKDVKKTTEYYQAGASKDQEAHPLQLFTIIKDFLSMVDQVCVEIARNLQRRKTTKPGSESSSSSPKSPPARTPTRFPNLPAHFMKSRSSSSDSDSDS